ncbi:unnamed protein product [Didymodactylos carnosus]|uniref:Phosphatidate phosphatase APP1 catalytic domain-containing protein n=1 Tax=Didymodactylos carnosus TaxID=1234261 RepID=A0A8S2FIP3_9BILA|nr:unnamed protein product [Didymodactylos carnosus]CAF4268036.1 unnamed protein product [Didymodactylos carnosus]
MFLMKILLYFILILVYLSLINTHLLQKLQDKLKNVANKKFGFGKSSYDYEETMLFPDVGFEKKDGDWRLNLHGWRFKISKRNKFLGESSSSIAQRLARLVASSEQIVYFNDSFRRDRLKPFMVQDKPYEKIQIEIGNQTFSTKTDSEGQFRTSFLLKNADIQMLKNNGQIAYRAIGDNNDTSRGIVYLLERKGLSVISDIDDTIKISEVVDKIRLMANTFIHKFRVVTGMPEIYRTWQEKHNCTFHYLSAMPDQLYAVTKDFIDDQEFPEGSFHMRHFRWASASIFNFVHSHDTKMHKINHLRYFIYNSVRQLILVGDSGELDPEIYGLIAQKYPRRVHSIFIRAVKGEKGNEERFLKAFKDIPTEKWMIFTNPEQLPKDLSPRKITT